MAMSRSTVLSPHGVPEAEVLVERRLGDGRDLPRQPAHGETIGPVGSDLHLEHLVGDGEVFAQTPAGLPLLGQHHGARALGRQTDLGLGHDHPRRHDAPQLGLADAGAVGHDAARQHHGHGLARGHVRRPAHDGARQRARRHPPSRPTACRRLDDAGIRGPCRPRSAAGCRRPGCPPRPPAPLRCR